MKPPNEELVQKFAGEVLCAYKYESYSGNLEQLRAEILKRMAEGGAPLRFQTCPRCEGHCNVYDYAAMAGPAQDFSRSFDQDAYVIPCPACQGSGQIPLLEAESTGSASPQGDLRNKAITYLRAAVEECRTGKTITFNVDHLVMLLDAFELSSGSVSTHGPCAKKADDPATCNHAVIRPAIMYEDAGDRKAYCCEDCATEFFAAAPAEDTKPHWIEEFLEHIQWMHDHAHNRIEQTSDFGATKGFRCIPVDSQLNAYLQGQRDTATELLARAREFKKSQPEDVQLDVELEKRIAEIRERESKATKGPWGQSHRQIPGDPEKMYATQVYDAEFKSIATLEWYNRPKPDGWVGSSREENADFIAHARQDIPFLLELALLRRVSGTGAQPSPEIRCPDCKDERISFSNPFVYCRNPKCEFMVRRDSPRVAEVFRPAPVPATPEEWPTGIEIHNRFCGHEGNICQACQLRPDNQRATTQGTPEGL